MISSSALESWCQGALGTAPAKILFEAGHLSTVLGLKLADGRAVVLKARPSTERLHTCIAVQRRLWAAGFPCPEPLAGPAPLGDLMATAEALVPGGEQLARDGDAPECFAAALARLVALAPPISTVGTLAPSLAWVWWDHDRPGLWPPPDDRDADLNAHLEPRWLDDIGRRVRWRLALCRLLPVIGHGDWESQNLRWIGRSLHVDCDSITLTEVQYGV